MTSFYDYARHALVLLEKFSTAWCLIISTSTLVCIVPATIFGINEGLHLNRVHYHSNYGVFKL